MDVEEINVIYEFKKLLSEVPGEIEPYESALIQLDPIVKRTSQDEKYRSTLANIERLWELLGNAVRGTKGTSDVRAVRFHYLRCVRGLLILMRNLSVNNQRTPQQLGLCEITAEMFPRLTIDSDFPDQMEVSLYVFVMSFLYNVTKTTSIQLDGETFSTLQRLLKYPFDKSILGGEVLYPYIMFFLNLTYSDEFLYYLLKWSDKIDILRDLLIVLASRDDQNNSSQEYWIPPLSNENEIGTLDTILLKIFANIVVNESFGPYLLNARTKDYRKFLSILRICQVVTTSCENWDKFQLIGIMTWCFQLIKETTRETEQYFKEAIEEEDRAKPKYEPLNMCLDIISNLSVNHQVQEYILSYGGLELLISLLRLLQKHLIRINFYRGINGSVKSIKTVSSCGEKIEDKELLSRRIDFTTNQIRSTNFPGTKSLIIEILTSLSHENGIVKTKVREQHGLELILSNCLIDDNDPFIKERSIMCIKFLLKDNPENQDFVAQLEAKKPVPDETLSDAGYQVKIDTNGRIRLESKK